MTKLPLVPLKNTVMFPGVVSPVYTELSNAVKAIDYAYAGKKMVFVTEQINGDRKRPEMSDIYNVGTVCKAVQTIFLPDGSLKVILEGLYRAKCSDILSGELFDEVNIERISSTGALLSLELEALRRRTLDEFNKYVRLLDGKISVDIINSVSSIPDSGMLADAISSYSLITSQQKHILLEEINVSERLSRLIVMLMNENDILTLEKQITKKVNQELEKSQRTFYLREKVKVIRKELGEDTLEYEIEDIKRRVSELNMSEANIDRVLKDVNRYEKLPPVTPEATVLKGYIDNILDIPWSIYTKDTISIENTKRILDEDHYGLVDIKQRIIEYLAVRKLAQKNPKANVLCFVGPPGVGKTSLARSIARAMSRKFVHMSLGGMHDESEIRGHRRTYVGAMPGRIIQKLQQCKTSNPVFLLDEIDKLASDFKGDPSSALLEVLDPEQNDSFSDNYLEIPYDLSQVFFITTANDLRTIPLPLLDRMEIIKLAGYRASEKYHIAKEYLLPKLLKEHGLDTYNVHFTDPAIRTIIELYTREAGVRSLTRQIAKILRKVALRTVNNIENGITHECKVSVSDVKRILGAPRNYKTVIPEHDVVGVSLGLAWTPVGGDVLLIESAVMGGKGKVTFTGNLGDVMKESVQTAIAYLRSHAEQYDLDGVKWEEINLHIHVPEGAIPKDGPSAGITIASSIYSSLSGKKVCCDYAMTGEMTLHGNVLPIGGVREKIIAAKSLGIKKLILPEANRADVVNLNKWITEGLILHYVRNISEVFDLAITKEE